MKKKELLFFVSTFFCVLFSFAQQVTTSTNSSLEQLIENNFGQGCVEISNISSTVNGNAIGLSSYGYFERADSNFPFQDGIVLTTGNVNSAGNVITTTPLNEGDPSWGTDTDLETALGIGQTLNATSIQFDFVSVANQIQFNYILASEEYQQEFPCFYSDGFAFLIREAGTNDPFTNIALIPNSNTPVNTNTVHEEILEFCPAENEEYFDGYNMGDTNYNGRTVVLSASASIQPNVQYQIKLVIADQGDQNYDSAVFIEGNSFDAVVDLGPDITTCGNSVDLNGNIDNNMASYQWFLDNAIISGANDPTFQATNSGTYKVEITITINNSECVIEDEIEVTLNSEQAAENISDYMLCDDASNDGVETFDLSIKDVEVLASVPPSSYNITYHYTASDAQNNINPITTPIQNTSNPQTIYVRIEDMVNGCLAYGEFNLVVNPVPEPIDIPPYEVCDDEVTDGLTTINLNEINAQLTGGNPNLFVSYHYSQMEADLGINPIPSPYNNINPTEQLFVRIIDATTGCFSTTDITITVMPKPQVNEETQWINSCEQDEDGFEEFDLESVIADVLQGLTGVEVTFHLAYEEAQTGENPIANTSNYQNVVQSFQLVYIRVVDEITGCYTIVNLELYANIIQTVFDLEAYSICDEIPADGIGEVDLDLVTQQITSGYNDFTLTFYETETDQQNDTNPINPNVPYVVNNSQTIYATVVSGDCLEFISVVLEVNPAVDIDPITVDYCDDEFADGFVNIDLFSLNATVSQGTPAANVKYYLTEDDAINNENILPQFFFNGTNPQQLWIRVTNAQTECYDIDVLTINIVGSPTINNPEDILVCVDGPDASAIVDLEQNITQVVTNPSQYNISYHNNFENASAGTNTFTSINTFETETRTVYIRVENPTSGCYSIANQAIYINTLPVIPEISDFENCEADIANVADFYFHLKDEEILNSQTGKEVLYYETEADANNGTNPINKFSSYQNTSSPQTIYIRVQNITDDQCFRVGSFEILVGSLPIFNPPSDIFVCDDASNDEVTTIDLSETSTEISNGVPLPLTLTYHESLYDANNSINELPLIYTNSINPQQLFVRIENGTYCHAVAAFELNVIQIPETNPASPMVVCDEDYDGQVTFDLTEIEFEILNVRQDNIEVTYHTSEDDLENNINPIPNPENYTNIENPQTVFIRVTNTISNCYANIPLDLIVNLPPVLNDFQDYEICDNTETYFDLTTINSVVVDDVSGLLFSYYTNLSDAEAGINSISTDYNYSSSSDTIYVRVENESTGCYATSNFNLIVNPLPVANIPDTLRSCDDQSNDDTEILDLSVQDNSVLGGQDPSLFTVTYYESLLEAQEGLTLLDTNYNGTDGQIIYVRIENNTTGCYSTTEFNIELIEHPEAPMPITLCDSNYDESTSFDLTSVEADLFQTAPNGSQFSYFESEDDLLANTNAIPNPESYSNLENPQTVFIRVDNTIANCFSYVSLELNVNLPPLVNPFEIYEACDNESDTFDLSEINEVIVDVSFNVLFSYYETEQDAIDQTNALGLTYNYPSNTNQLYARVEFSTTHCFFIYPFELNINPSPIANQPTNLESCDDDFDGFYEFDLTVKDQEILGTQSPTNFTVTYYGNEEDALNNENSLDTNFIANGGEVIYAVVTNITTGCQEITSFFIVLRPRPDVAIPNQVICLDNLPLIVSADTGNSNDSYLWSTNASTSEIEITEVGMYSVTVTSQFGCQTTSTFEVSESEGAVIDVVETVDFSDPNNITITVSGIGNYLYQLDNGTPQESNVFENVTLGYHTITIIDLNGCSETIREVVVIDAPKFFTPNGDNVNETWHIIGVETLPGTIVHVFDRFGKLMTTLTADSRGWDGRYNGNNMPAADYWFLAQVVKGDVAFEVKGHFALRR